MNATADEPATVCRMIQAAWLGSVPAPVGVIAVGMTIAYRDPEILAAAGFTGLLDDLGDRVWLAVGLGPLLLYLSATILAGLVWSGR